MNGVTSKCRFAYDLRPFFNCSAYADVRLIVQGPAPDNLEEVFFAHKIILCLSSEMFAAMFSQQMREGLTNTVVINDTDPASFELLLRYLYSYDITILESNVFPLLDLAKKYQVTRLTERCSAFLEEQSRSPEDVYKILPVAMRYQCDALIEKCCATLLARDQDVVRTRRYLDLDQHTFVELLKSDHWSVDEDQIFDVALDWVLARRRPDQSLQEVFMPLVPYLRFPHMTVQKLFEVREKGLVADELLCDVTFFRLGACDVRWLDRQMFRHRRSVVDFVSTEGFEVSKDPNTLKVHVRRTGSGGRCIRTRKRIGSGRHEMNFRIVGNPRDIIFGVVEAEDTSLVAHEASGRMVGCHMQKRRHKGSFFSRPGGDSSMETGDTVRCVLDLHLGQVLYTVNGAAFEIAFDDLPRAGPEVEHDQNNPETGDLNVERRQKGYMFCIDMYTEGTEVEVL